MRIEFDFVIAVVKNLAICMTGNGLKHVISKRLIGMFHCVSFGKKDTAQTVKKFVVNGLIGSVQLPHT